MWNVSEMVYVVNGDIDNSWFYKWRDSLSLSLSLSPF